MKVPGVNVVARLVKKIPGYKGVVRTTARVAKQAGPVARATGRVASRGVGAIRNGAVVVGKKSRNITRRIGKLFGRKSKSRARAKSRSAKKSRSKPKSRATRSRNNRNRNVVLNNVKRNNAPKPVVAPVVAPAVTPAVAPVPVAPVVAPAVAPAVAPVVAPVPAPAPALAIKNTNSPLVGAVGNMAIAPRPY